MTPSPQEFIVPSRRPASLSLGTRLACGVWLASLSACTALVTTPERPTVEKRAAGLSYLDGLAYLENARKNMEASESKVDNIDQATKGMVGVGMGGGAIAALLHSSSDVVAGLVGLGGIGYTTNKSSVLSVQSEIISEGKGNLTCIERSAERLHLKTAGARVNLQAQEPLLAAAIARLTNDLADSRKEQATPDLTRLQADAETLLKAANALLQRLDEYIATTDVGFEMYVAVNQTVDTVNAQLRRQTLDVEALSKSGSMLQAFVTAHTSVDAQAKATSEALAAKGANLVAMAHAANVPPIIAALTNDLNSLRLAVAAVESALPITPTADFTQVADCKTQIPGAGPVTVEPAGPITLIVGGSATNLRITGNQTLSARWLAKVPTASQLVVSKPTNDTLSLSAPAGAPSDTYILYLHQDSPEKRSDDVTIRVEQPPQTRGTVARTSNGGVDGPRTNSAAPSELKQFLDWRHKLGLDDTVKSTSDPRWSTRIRVLESCLQLAVTGKASDTLKARLDASEPVNPNGDCPKAKASAVPPPPTLAPPATSPSAPPGAASQPAHAVPIPSSPKL